MSTDTASGQPDDTATNEKNAEYHNYRCPFCSASYDNEILCRTHITRSEDAPHLNRNGFMPDVKIKLIDDNDEIIRKISRRPEDIDPEDLTVDDLPEEKPKQHKHILLVAARHPDESDYKTLTETANQVLEYHDLDTLSYSSIRRIIRSFYRPTEEKTTGRSGESEEEETLSDCTSLQQAIIISHLMHPTELMSDLADLVGCAESYPSQVLDNKKPVHSELKSEIEAGENPEDVIRSHLDDNSIVKLSQQDLLEDVDIAITEQNDDSSDDLWSLSLEPQNVTEDGQPNQNTGVKGENEIRQDGTQSSKTSREKPTLNKSIRKNEVEKLKQKVVFLRRVLERANDLGDNDLGMTIALAQQTEQALQNILEEQ